MNLAIEYILRDKKVHNLLSLPCSLLLTTEHGNKFVVTISNSWGDEDLLVKHWRLWETTSIDRLPPFIEVKISRKDIFTSPMTVIENCYIIEYKEDPFEYGKRQHSDYPLAFEETVQYQNYLDNFYSSNINKEARVNWLWSEFDRIYVPINLRVEYGEEGKQLQMEILQLYSKDLWCKWLHWRRYLLDFDGAASELVFKNEYKSKKVKKRVIMLGM